MNSFLTIKKEIPIGVELVAVSKTYPPSVIQEVYNAGQRAFGENKVQEVVQKQAVLPNDIEWHFIGHLQTNKVKQIAPFIKLIHSVDSFKLLKTINLESEKNNRAIDCLLEFHIGEEETKFGLDLPEAIKILENPEYKTLNNIRIVGVMGMATFTDDRTQISMEFTRLREIFTQLKQSYFNKNSYFREISMGMSDDYKIAIEEGSTMVRIGSAIFGKRNQLSL